ncbi:hypothetical protein ABIC60_000613 [Phyllobacterium ifriqiyense]
MKVTPRVRAQPRKTTHGDSKWNTLEERVEALPLFSRSVPYRDGARLQSFKGQLWRSVNTNSEASADDTYIKFVRLWRSSLRPEKRVAANPFSNIINKLLGGLAGPIFSTDIAPALLPWSQPSYLPAKQHKTLPGWHSNYSQQHDQQDLS